MPTAEPTAVPARAEVGFAPPAIELPDLDGNPASLATFRGQVVLLNFWALWCDPCKAELPDFQAALDRYGARGFAVVTVDLGDQPKKVAAFIEEHGYRFTVLADASLKAAQAYDTRILPLSLLIDRQGIIRYLRVAPFEAGQLSAQIEALLNEEP